MRAQGGNTVLPDARGGNGVCVVAVATSLHKLERIDFPSRTIDGDNTECRTVRRDNARRFSVR